MSDILPVIEQHLKELVKLKSITPLDAGCQLYIKTILENRGFRCQTWQINQVSNLYAEIGTQGPRFVFAGHTDVVEPGPLQQWRFPPFELTEHEGYLYGRGVADMKGAVAAMLAVASQWKASNPGILGFLITSGEEGQDYQDGTPFVMQALQQQGIHIDYCIVGEPSSDSITGDTIKNGRRGSLSATLTISGAQGHVAYPHHADNAIHKALPFLTALSAKIWDMGNTFFPASTLQITRVFVPTSARNVIPGTLEVDFNIRFNTEHDSVSIKQQILDLAKHHGIEANFEWELSGEPFITPLGKLIEISQNVIQKHLGHTAVLSTSGGTSDARFIAPYQIQVIELGVPNASIHQPNECVSKVELTQLAHLYLEICTTLLS